MTEDFSEVLLTQEVTFAMKGYHTVELDEELELGSFAVVIAFEGAASVEGESWSDVGIRYEVGIEEGQSFVRIGEEWCDLAKEETASALAIDFVPNNCCVKALYKAE